MKVVELEEYLAVLEPWELVIRIGGVGYATRPLVLADLAVLEKAERGELGIQQLIDTVRGLFAHKPDLGHLRSEALLAIVALVMGHFNAQAKKNAQAVAAKIQASHGAPGN